MYRIPFFLISGLFLFFHPLKAQQDLGLAFENTVHDFGNIKEVDGAVEVDFTFRNTSGKPLIITRVKASCGCTTPKWTRDTLQIGEVGSITARYDTRNRPGDFNKSLTVYTNIGGGRSTRLYIKGSVIPRPKSLKEEFPIDAGVIRLKYNIFNMSRIRLDGRLQSKKYPIYNAAEETLVLSDSILHPDWVDVQFSTHLLQPKERGEIILSINTSEVKDKLGFQNESITFFTGTGNQVQTHTHSIYVNFEDYFPPMSAQELRNAPNISVSKSLVDMGRIAPNAVSTTSVTVTNIGKQELIIRKVDPNCSCVSVAADQETIAPGSSTRLDIEFDTKGRKGNQDKSISIYTNSPSKPIVRLKLRAYIESND